MPGKKATKNQVKKQLKIAISQVGSPPIYWTSSCAEFHRPEFHSFFDETGLFNNNSGRRNIANNPQCFTE